MYRVLLVDDYQVYRKEIRSMPVWGDKSGFEMTDEAANGRDAISRLQQHSVDLVLTDIRMPLINGLELLKRVTEDKLCACVILMSQFSNFEYARQGLSDGAFEYLLKPVDPDELLKVLLRAAAHIKERSQEISKMSYLDEILNKSSDEFFPVEELDNVVQLINEGSLGALDAASHLVDFTYSEINFDVIKTAHILNSALKKLIEAVQGDFP